MQELEILDLYDNNFGQPFLFGRRLLQISPPLPSSPPSPTEEAPIDFPFFLPPPTGSQAPPQNTKRANPPTESQTNIPDPPPVPPSPAQPPPAQPPPAQSPPPHDGNNKRTHKIYIIVGVLVGVSGVMAALVVFFLLWNQKVKMIKPWGATGSSGQLQDVVTTGISTVLCLLCS